MIGFRFIPLVLKQATRRPARSALTILGVAIAMLLFVVVQALQRGVADATESTGREVTLVVYRENRFCPATSRLPNAYLSRLKRIPGVESVLPMKIVVNNCGASLDTITFRGVPRDASGEITNSLVLLSGSLEDWRRRGDAALVGEVLAARRGVKSGDMLSGAGVDVYIAGIVRSSEPQDQNVAYVDLGFLQRAARQGGDGVVTQFNVRVTDPARLTEVASAIDDEFRKDAEPTDTRPEKAFVARAAHDLVQLIGFSRYIGWAGLAAVLALAANAITLSVRDRIREHAVLRTLGFRRGLIARLIIAESAMLCLAGGALGSLGAFALLRFGQFSLSLEGTNIIVPAEPLLVLVGLFCTLAAGVLAALLPALHASRTPISQSFRAV